MTSTIFSTMNLGSYKASILKRRQCTSSPSHSTDCRRLRSAFVLSNSSYSAPEPGVSGLSDPSQTQGNQGSYHDLISPTSSASFSSSLMPGYHPYAIQNHHAPPGPAQQPWISHHDSLPVSSVVTEPIHDNFSFPAHGAMTAYVFRIQQQPTTLTIRFICQ